MTSPEFIIRPEDMKKLRDFYIGTIPEKLDLIEKLIKEMEETVHEKTLVDLRLHIHKIAGSAGTYGFSTVSLTCKQFENEIIQRMQEIKNSPGDPGWAISFFVYLEKIKEGFLMSNISKTNSKNKNIVIVDDDIDLLKLLVFAFESNGFNIHGIGSGEEALKFFQNEDNIKSVHLLILDRILPDMDGLNLLSQVPQILQNKIPVLILSLLSTDDDKNNVLAEGAVDCMGKPFNLFTLIVKAEYLIERFAKEKMEV